MSKQGQKCGRCVMVEAEEDLTERLRLYGRAIKEWERGTHSTLQKRITGLLKLPRQVRHTAVCRSLSELGVEHRASTRSEETCPDFLAIRLTHIDRLILERSIGAPTVASSSQKESEGVQDGRSGSVAVPTEVQSLQERKVRRAPELYLPSSKSRRCEPRLQEPSPLLNVVRSVSIGSGCVGWGGAVERACQMKLSVPTPSYVECAFWGAKSSKATILREISTILAWGDALQVNPAMFEEVGLMRYSEVDAAHAGSFDAKVLCLLNIIEWKNIFPQPVRAAQDLQLEGRSIEVGVATSVGLNCFISAGIQVLLGQVSRQELAAPLSSHNLLCADIRRRGVQAGCWSAQGFIEATETSWSFVCMSLYLPPPPRSLVILAGWQGGGGQHLGSVGAPQALMYNYVGVHFEPARFA